MSNDDNDDYDDFELRIWDPIVLPKAMSIALNKAVPVDSTVYLLTKNGLVKKL